MPWVPETVLPVLLGGIGGAVMAFVLQGWRDHLQSRRRIASAAIVMRMELVANGSIVINVVQGFRPPGTDVVLALERSAFDRLISEVAASLTDSQLLELLNLKGYFHMADAYVRRARAGGLSKTELAFLTEEYMPVNGRCQVLLRFLAAPWYVKLRRYRDWLDLNSEMDQHIRETQERGPARSQAPP